MGRGQSEISLSKVDEAEASGMDGSHWLVVCEPPFEIKFVQIYADYYAKLLEPYVGSEKEAKKIIYSISKEIYFGFGAVLTEETVKNLRGLDGIFLVVPDTYVNIHHKVYAGN
ncbi:multiple organellar RNA editing factor 5, chloroplastic/mitochondrial-like [Trifolium pratense]|uniref:multiple organellar RNA editing factor 5, chloroplastic/mitochondrial-like n=1 Tax=Trifolium pratense TaxID=57577 RepID=UPI001E69017F|nr:multiple organellar RNA editing factor 5, chloroplastic/mitochondrial-like [Trifolium pratense]